MHCGLEAAAGRFGDRVAIRAGDESWSWRDLDQLAGASSRHLADRGVTAGDRVAVMTSNRVEFVATVHGISRLGAAAVLLSPAWRATEVDHALGITAPRHAVADGDAVALLTDRLGTAAVTDLDDPASPGTAYTDAAGPPATGPSPDDDVILVFSSGTTGLPKAVRHTHRTMGHATTHWCAALGLGPDDRFQVATPPSHILGLLNLLAAAEAGASVRLHRRFDLDEVLRCIEADHITLEMAVAPIALALANHPDLERYDLSSLRYIMWGATPVTPSVAEAVTARIGVRWLAGYGASELPVIAVNPVDDPSAWRLDSAGLPPADVELRVGDAGEIQARSPSVMAGYLPNDANADAFTSDGWYRTGDVGWLEPEGWVHLTDRSKEMIKVNGFQVAPAEVEGVLLGHPGIVDCAVFGVPHPRTGEAVVAAVVRSADTDASADDLRRLVADRLASYKRLAEVVVVEKIPRLPSGKVLRRELKANQLDRPG